MIIPGIDPTKVEDTRSLIPCHFYPNCLNANCPFYHPPAPAKTTTEGSTDTNTNENGTTLPTTENIVKPITELVKYYNNINIKFRSTIYFRKYIKIWRDNR